MTFISKKPFTKRVSKIFSGIHILFLTFYEFHNNQCGDFPIRLLKLMNMIWDLFLEKKNRTLAIEM